MFWNKKEKEIMSLPTPMLGYPPPPKTNEYKTIFTLLEDAERWRNIGDKELERKTWEMIAEKAKKYSEGQREKYIATIKTYCGEIHVPSPTSPDDEDLMVSAK